MGDDREAIALLAVLAGLVAATGPAPTGHPLTDAVLVGGGVALLVPIGARAPWWAVAGAAGVALAIAVDPLLMVLGAAGLAVALWSGARPVPSPTVSAASLAVTCNVLARAELGGMLGSSAIASLSVAALLFVLGTSRLARRPRLLAWGGVVLLAVAAGAATAGFGYAAVQARHELSAGLTTAELGVSALESGDFDAAADWFAQAGTYLDAADEHLGAPWAGAASVVPVVAQHHAAVTGMTDAGAAGVATVAAALREIDVGELRPVAGRFDLAALAALEGPLTRVRDALVELRRTTDESRSPWLVGRATYELDDFAASVDEHLPSLEQALAAIRMAPDMLGADEARTYLLLFTTPAEARGLGGFVGSYAELVVDDGQLVLGAFGRSQDLDRQAQVAGARVRGQEEFLALYGRFGFDAAGDGSGLVGDSALRNVAMTPHFPTVATIAADLYEQTTGTAVDGVIAMDPYVVAALLGYTGTVHLPSLGQDVDPESAAAFLLRDQYAVGTADDDTRADALAEAAAQAFAGLIGGALPEPIELARDLGPLTGQRRLLVWSRHADEQELLEEVHVGGGIPPLDGADGWSFTVSNAGGNKIDSFLDRRADHVATTDPDTGVTTGTVRIELTNTAPAEGFPRYVIGNRVGKPAGTSSLWVTVYSPLGLDGLTVDGAPAGVEAGTEHGWQAYRLLVDIPPGATVRVEAALSGTVGRPDEVVTWTQPMADDLEGL